MHEMTILPFLLALSCILCIARMVAWFPMKSGEILVVLNLLN